MHSGSNHFHAVGSEVRYMIGEANSLKGLSEALCQEVEPLGIKVMLS